MKFFFSLDNKHTAGGERRGVRLGAGSGGVLGFGGGCCKGGAVLIPVSRARWCLEKAREGGLDRRASCNAK